MTTFIAVHPEALEQGESYLLCFQGESDDGHGLEEVRGLPCWVLGIGAVHQAKELKNTAGEGLVPGTVS